MAVLLNGKPIGTAEAGGQEWEIVTLTVPFFLVQGTQRIMVTAEDQPVQLQSLEIRPVN